MKQLVILAGGRGTRLADTVRDLPKPMAPVAGRPVLEHQLGIARAGGFTDIHLLTHYRAEVIRDYFGDGSRFGIDVHYHSESTPLGTAGAVLEALPSLADRFAVLYGDTMMDVDLDRLWRRHLDSGADATLFVHPNDHPHDSDLVEIDDNDWIRAFHPHPRHEGAWLRNLVNAALYVVEKRALSPWAPPEGKLDFAHDLFPRMLTAGAKLQAYRSREYIKDMGTPDRLARVEADFNSGLVARLSLRDPCPAVFIDRDGTLNVEVNRVQTTDQLLLIENVGAAVHRLNRSGLPAIVITNQPVIARGDCTEEELQEIHNKLEVLLGRDGAYLDGIYYCPHHPDRGFEGERVELKIPCDCRKPGTALIEQACRDLDIRLEDSWLIGDSTTDIQAAHNAGIRSALVRTGHAGRDRRWPVHPDYEFLDLSEAVDFILDDHATLLEQGAASLPVCAPGQILAIGGLARSGKSTWAAILKEVLAGRGLNGIIIPLDSWLKSHYERQPGHVLNRYDLTGIEDTVRKLARRSSHLGLQLGSYNRMSRTGGHQETRLTIAPDDVVLFEGVPALMIPDLVEAASSRIFVECSEETRKKRFFLEYRLRGFADAEIESLYKDRDRDEHPFVIESANAADITIRGSR